MRAKGGGSRSLFFTFRFDLIRVPALRYKLIANIRTVEFTASPASPTSPMPRVAPGAAAGGIEEALAEKAAAAASSPGEAKAAPLNLAAGSE